MHRHGTPVHVRKRRTGWAQSQLRALNVYQRASMHTSNISSAVRAHAPSPLEEIPPDLLPLVVSHISLREGRSISSLARISRLFAQRMVPHLKPATLYRDLENARVGTQPDALHCCMSVLYELPAVHELHRLELFLLVKAVLERHFDRETLDPHIGTVVAGMRCLSKEDQTAALLGIVAYGNAFSGLYATEPRYQDIAGRIGALQPSTAQIQLADVLLASIYLPGLGQKGFAKRVAAFLAMCRRLQPLYRAEVLSNLLHQITYPSSANVNVLDHPSSDAEQAAWRRHLLFSAVHDCLQSMRMHELPVHKRATLIGCALLMPPYYSDAAQRDDMVSSLLKMIPPEDEVLYALAVGGSGVSFGKRVQETLCDTFGCLPQDSSHRFERLYQAISHLPASRQIEWIRSILHRSAKYNGAGAPPALIVASAQAALQPGDAIPSALFDLFAACLNPGRLYPTNDYTPLTLEESDSSEGHVYTLGFHAKCSEMMHLLRNVPRAIAGRLLAGINSAYKEKRYLHDILPGPNRLRTELYACFLTLSLPFLKSLPTADAAACLLQWRLPPLQSVDARHADDWTTSLATAVAEISRDSGLVSLEEQKTALGELLKQGIDVELHSPVRNRRLLDVLAAVPDVVCAEVLTRLLIDECMGFAHADVLFASVIEAACRLPDALRAGVLATAAGRLRHFPVLRWQWGGPETLGEERKKYFDREHPGLQESDPGLHATIQPGHVSRVEGFALLLDAVETLPAQDQADQFRQLCDRKNFFDFSNNRLSQAEKAQCTMRLVSSIIRLPGEMSEIRAEAFSGWLKHVYHQRYQEVWRATIETGLLSLLFALPAGDGKPLFDAYLATVSDAPAKAALQERARKNWAIGS